MKLKKIITFLFVSAIAFSAFADTFRLSEKEQADITEDAENWIDNMMPGMQDRLSDAVDHAMRGFYSEIEIFRHYKDTVGLNSYPVTVDEFKGGSNDDILMRSYKASNTVEKTILPLLIYFHGGGWSMGSLDTSERFCKALASEGKVIVISVDYPLAPEHKFPGALNTCKDAINFIIKNAQKWGSSSELVSLGGDGAGGNLAIVSYENLPKETIIKSLVLFYPLIKSTGQLTPDLKRKYGRGFGFDSRLWESYIEAYESTETEYPKPLPPTLIISAARDIILDQEMNFITNNDSIQTVEFTGALHGFITDGQQKTAFNKAVEITNLFLSNN